MISDAQGGKPKAYRKGSGKATVRVRQPIPTTLMKFLSLANIPETGVSHNPEIRKKVLIRNGDVPHLTNLSRSELQPGQTASSHAHADMYEVFMVESGSGKVTVDGVSRAFTKGDCVVVEPGEHHEIVNHSQASLVLIYFGIEH